MLQTRSAKRTAAAAIKAAVDMAAEGLISREEAIARIDPSQLDQLLHPMLDPTADFDVGGARPQRVPGRGVRRDRARRRHGGGARQGRRAGDPRPLGDDAGRHPRDDPGDGRPHRARRHDLARGGRRARHGQAVRRRLRRPRHRRGREDHHPRRPRCCTRATRSRSTAAPAASSSARSQLVPPQINEDFETILGLGRRGPPAAGVRANADNPRGRGEGARVRRPGHRPLPHRAHVLRRGAAAGRAGDDPRRPTSRAAARRSTGCCRSSRRTSRGSSRRWPGCRSTIRLLDPPLHEFLPPLEEATDERMRSRIKALHESNPMLGTRGCRLGIQWPEIYEMQVRAIARAAKAVHERTGDDAARRDHAPARRASRRSCAGCASSPSA